MLGDEAHFLSAKVIQLMGVQVMAGRRTDERRCVMQPILYKAWRRLPEKGACHPQEVEGVIVPEKVKRGLWDGVTAHGGRHRDAWGESCAGGIGLKINANAMDVLGVLQEEPGAGEVLLTCGTYIAGGLIPSTCKTQKTPITTSNLTAIYLCTLLMHYFALLYQDFTVKSN